MTGHIFLNYRREDSAAYTGRLYDRLEDEFGPEQLFIDIDHINAGEDFVQVLDDRVSRCDILLAVIGRNWETIKGPAQNRRRLDDPNDFVRIELRSALKRNIHIIPVLVDGAIMPSAKNLPTDIRALARRNAVRLTHERFRADVAGLINSLHAVLTKISADKKSGPPPSQSDDEMSNEDFRRLEEYANWGRIVESNEEAAFRDHLARFPNGATVAQATAKLEAVAWSNVNLAFDPDPELIQNYIDEFPDGAFVEAARSKLKTAVAASQIYDFKPAISSPVATQPCFVCGGNGFLLATHNKRATCHHCRGTGKRS